MKTLDLNEAAQFLRMHPKTLGKKVRAGEIPGSVNRNILTFNEETLIGYIRSLYPISKHMQRQNQLREYISTTTEDIESRITPVPIFSGVYFLYSKGAVVYVGKSKNILARLGSHCPEKEFDSYSCIKIPTDLLDEVEQYFIFKLKPSLNKTHLSLFDGNIQ